MANLSIGKNSEYIFSLISLPDAVRDIPSRGVFPAFLSIDVAPASHPNLQIKKNKKKELVRMHMSATVCAVLKCNALGYDLPADALRLVVAIFGWDRSR